MNRERIETMLKELGLEFTSDTSETGIVGYTISIDREEGLEISALLYEVEDEGDYLRLMAYVDEVDPDEPLLQTRLLLELNVELPYGAFCLEPEENYIFFTANTPTEGLTSEDLGSLIELLFVAQTIYDSELGPEDGEIVAQG